VVWTLVNPLRKKNRKKTEGEEEEKEEEEKKKKKKKKKKIVTIDLPSCGSVCQAYWLLDKGSITVEELQETQLLLFGS
jgi:hypothetical protein